MSQAPDDPPAKPRKRKPRRVQRGVLRPYVRVTASGERWWWVVVPGQGRKALSLPEAAATRRARGVAVSRPVADWRTLLPTLWTVVQGDAPAWVSERTRTHAQRLLAALTADVENAIETAGGAAAAEPVTGIDRNLISRWRRAKILKRE